MNKNKQLTLNFALSITSFIIGTAITFFLTPYIVGTLGRAAYGFIGLSSTIISYTSLITVALNAMAGRFISINYLQGNINDANKYFASVFYSNLFLSAIISILGVLFLIFINKMLDVPNDLLFDVRLLFSLFTINSVFGLVTGIFGLGTFIKKRLDLSYSRGIIGRFLGASILVCLFTFFSPHIWYYGIHALIMSLYAYITNRIFLRRLTPDLRIKISNYDIKKVIELIKAGSWNIINKLSGMLSHGFDLIFANIFVGAAAMGTFSLSKTLSMMVLGLFGSFSGNFSPELTELYAQNRTNELIAELQKSIKLLSCFSTPILCALYIFTGDFFRLWLPLQDHQFLYLLATLGFLASPFTLPYEGLWNIFTLTNKLKVSSLTLFAESICVFTTVLSSMLLIKDVNMRLIILAGSRTAWGILRNSLFLPMYGAHCLNIKLTTFYRYEFKALFCLVFSCFICYVLKQQININNWLLLIIAVGTCCIISFAINFFFVLDNDDKRYLITTLKNNITKI